MYNTELRVSYAHHTQFAVSDLHFATVYGLRTDLGGCKIFGGGGMPLCVKVRTNVVCPAMLCPSNGDVLATPLLGYRSSLSVACMVRFWFKSFQNSTVHKTSLVQGSPFLLAVYTHEVPLCLCSVFCSHSQVRLSTARYRGAFGARTTPQTASHNLNHMHSMVLTV